MFVDDNILQTKLYIQNHIKAVMQNHIGENTSKEAFISELHNYLSSLKRHSITGDYNIKIVEENEDMRATREVLEEPPPSEIIIETNIQLKNKIEFITMEFKLDEKV